MASHARDMPAARGRDPTGRSGGATRFARRKKSRVFRLQTSCCFRLKWGVILCLPLPLHRLPALRNTAGFPPLDSSQNS